VVSIEINPVWVFIFGWTLVIFSVCLFFGLKLIRSIPSRFSSVSLGLNFIGQAINFITYPFIVLDESVAIPSYKIQIIGYMLSSLTSFLFGRSLTKRPGFKLVIATTGPALIIILLVWIIAPFTPVEVSYGYELEIEGWFLGLLAIYGYIALIYLLRELVKIYRTTTDPTIKKRLIYLIGGYVSLVSSMTLLLTVLPLMFNSAEIKPFGIMVATICMIYIYLGYRPDKNDDSKRKIFES